MKKQLQKKSLGISGVLLALVASAEPGASPAIPYTLVKPEPKSLNRFGVSYRMGFNISAKFTDLGGSVVPLPSQGGTPMTSDGPNGPQPFNYDDGYVFVDDHNNDHTFNGAFPEGANLTTYWGVQNQSQLGDGTATFHRTTVAAGGESRAEDDPQHGVEFTYSRQLGDVWRGHWGVEAAFNYMPICLADNHPPSRYVSETTDIYNVPGGVAPIQAPFNGSYYGAPIGQPQTPFLSYTWNSSTTILSADLLSGYRRLSADIYGFRLGPYFEIPLGERVSIYLSGGLGVACVDSDFSYEDTTSSRTVTANGSRSDVLWGGYVAGTISVALNEAWSLNAGVQYQDVGKFSQDVGTKRAELDLSESLFVTIGVSYKF